MAMLVLAPGMAASALAQLPIPAALNAELQAAGPGDVVNLHGATGSIYLNQSPNQQEMMPGTLVYSDDPETVDDYGILYRSSVPAGPTRVYAYHVNGLAAPAKITAVLENAGDTAAGVSFARKSLRPPSGNYLHVGKNAVREYYENTTMPSDITVPPGGAALLDPAMDGLTVLKDQLVSAKYDLVSDRPLIITTLMLPAGASTIAANATATILPGDGKNRQGTFQHWEKTNQIPYNYSTSDNSRLIKIGDGSPYDAYVSGIDHERDVATVLRGNFGVRYVFRINVTSPDGKGLAVLLNPRGGAHAGYMRSTFPSGATPQGHLLPSDTLALNDNTKAVVCAKMRPTASPQLLTLEYMPPGASSLPINLMLLPFTDLTTVADWEIY